MEFEYGVCRKVAESDSTFSRFRLICRVLTVHELRDFYASQMGDTLQCVECRVLGLDGVQSIWVIAKGKDEQSGGAVYIGSLTLPFKDFSFVIKIQCYEGNITGVREALLVEKALRDAP